MRFEYLILLIIAFNVVAAVVKNRAKKSREPGSRRDESARDAMPGLGRDILDQLARDLGLRLPRPVEPEPASGEAPAPVYAGEVRDGNPRERERAVERTPEKSPTPSPVAPARGVRSQPARSRTAVGASPLRDSLLGKDRLREAFILKEILDPPLARRGRR